MMVKKIRISCNLIENNSDHVRLRVDVADVKRIIEKVYEVENWINFEDIDENYRQCRFEPNQLDFEDYEKKKKNRFWITRTEPVRLGWTGKFPKDGRFTVTVKCLPPGVDARKNMKKLLQHFCRNPDEPSPIMHEADKIFCSLFIESLQQGQGKHNPFLWALLKRYWDDPHLREQEGYNSLMLTMWSHFKRDNQDRGQEESGNLYHKRRIDVEEIIKDMNDISIDKSCKTSKFVNTVREGEGDILPTLIRSKPYDALNLITVVTRFDILFSCNFTRIIERLQIIEGYVENNCHEEVVKAKFYYHFGEILTKASRFVEAEENLQKADTILMKVFILDKNVILDLLSVKILLGRCHFLCLRSEEAKLQLEQANELFQVYVYSSDYVQDRIHFKRVEAFMLSAEMALKKCHYQEAKNISHQALLLFTEPSLHRDWNTYILEATCTRLLSDALTNLSHFDKAEECIFEVLSLFIKYLDEEDHQEIAKCYVRLGDVKCLKGNFTEGLEFLLEALKMRQRIFPNPEANPEVAASLNRVGYAYHVIGELEKARDFFEKAREIRTNIYKDSVHITTLYISYPSCLYSNEDMEIACNQYDNLQEQAAEPHLAHASAKHRRGDIWFARKHWDRALHSYGEALKIRQQFEQLLAVAATHYAIGKCFVAVNDLECARKSFLEANRLRIRLLNADKEIYLQLATVYLKQHKFGEAEGYLNAAIDTCGGDIRLKLETVLSNIRTEGMSDEEINCVVNTIWSIPAEPYLLV